MRRLLTGFANRDDALVRHAASALVTRQMATVLGLVHNVVLARSLGAESVGDYFLAFSITSIVAMLARVGLSDPVIRFSAQRVLSDGLAGVWAVYRSAIGVAALGSLAAVALLVLGAPFIADTMLGRPHLTAAVRGLALAVPFQVALNLTASIFTGLQRTTYSVFVQFTLPTTILVLATSVLAPRYGLVGAVLAFTASYAIAAVWAVGGWLWTARAARSPSVTASARAMIGAGVPMWWQQLFQQALRWAPLWIIGAWVGSEAVGIYNIANRTAFAISFILLAVNVVSSPRFARFYQQDDVASIGRLARTTSTIMALAALPILLVFVAFPAAVMSIFGSDFRQAGPLLVIMAAGQYFSTVTGSVQRILVMTGREAILRNISLLGAVVIVALSLILVPGWGATGAAVAFSVALIVQNVLAARAVRRTLRIEPLPLPWRRRPAS